MWTQSLSCESTQRAVGRLLGWQLTRLRTSAAVPGSVYPGHRPVPAWPDFDQYAVVPGPGPVLVYPQCSRPADRSVARIEEPLKLPENFRPSPVLVPMVVAVEVGRGRAVAIRKAAPRSTAPENVEDAVHDPAVVVPFAGFVGQGGFLR